MALRPRRLVRGAGRRVAAAGKDGGVGGLCRQLSCLERPLDDALQRVEDLIRRGFQVSIHIFHRLLKSCINSKNLAAGRQLQTLMLSNGHEFNAYLGNHLIRLFASCGSLNEAIQAFRKLPGPDIHSWAAIISAHVKSEHGEGAIKLYHEMQRSPLKPNDYVYVAVLQACTDTANLAEGRLIHGQLVENGYGSNVFVGNTLVDMYSKCGSLHDASSVFEKLPSRDIVSWNAMITGHAQNGHINGAFKLFQTMLEEGLKPDAFTYVSILKACRNEKAPELGRVMHRHIVESGYDSDELVGSILIDMYAKWGCIDEAHRVFDRLPKRYTVSWNTLITGYVQNELGQDALQLYERMLQQSVKPDGITFVSVLKACSGLGAVDQGKSIHSQIIKSRLESDVFVGSTLVDMYAKYGNMEEAFRAFDKIQNKNLVSWNAIIAGYAQHARGREALQLFERMQLDGIKPNGITFVSTLKACSTIAAMDQGKKIHAQISKDQLDSDMFVASALVDMYSKCGSLDHARQVFDKLPRRDVVMWNAMIGGYVQHGFAKDALKLFTDLQQQDINPNVVTFLSLLKACTDLQSLDDAKPVLAEIKKTGLESNALVGNTLVDMFAKCGSLEKAEEAFANLSERNVVSWNALISGYVKTGGGRQALELYKKMRSQGVKPDVITFVNLLKACGSILAVDEGRLIHSEIKKSELESNAFIGSSLVDMYANCGDLNEARQVFDKLSKRDVVLWNAMIEGYAQRGFSEQAFEILGAMQQEGYSHQGFGQQALQLFKEMQTQGIKPDKFTFWSILKACGSIPDLNEGKLIHMQISKSPFNSDPFVRSALADMYAKCGSLDEAQGVFDELVEKDLASWNAMIAGYATNGGGEQAILLFQKMQQTDVKPDAITFSNVLKACGNITSIEHGKLIHHFLVKSGIQPNLHVGNTLVDMYAKCGSLDEAHQVFEDLLEKDLVTWNALMGGYAQHGLGPQALRLFDKMKQEGMMPDDITFINLLSACSHSRLVDEGVCLFRSMFQDYGMIPKIQHYVCMVDLLSRAGNLCEAEHFINTMPCKPDATVWMPLLGACQTYANVELGGRSFASILKIDPTNFAAHVLMSNIYAAAGRWKDTAFIKKNMNLAGTLKAPGLDD
ncbi:hypothetical protein O6H91_14G060500 [Diphasiastrum complanatum]|uniref:Uncharacterized protein n=1 Tax=Diphasiastrum complanatum TaxID=34168 RepID=A0ACC2BPT4_DIPCM|nr:hypothetical protein O6H91_14G060500 [Diphasiastrum complanatum]